MTTKLTTSGVRHVALNVTALEDCLSFYTDVIGMAIEWQPDADNVFLCSGNDNLALHRMPVPDSGTANKNDSGTANKKEKDRLDHIGFIIDKMDDIDRWHQRLLDQGVSIAQAPKTHRDGARSLYCYDPDGTLVQLIYHPPLSSG